MNPLMRRAMQQPDGLVVEFDSTDAKGVSTRRVVSPIRFAGQGPIPGPGVGLCREEPRQFYVERCRNIRLARAADFLMPVAMGGISGRLILRRRASLWRVICLPPDAYENGINTRGN